MDFTNIYFSLWSLGLQRALPATVQPARVDAPLSPEERRTIRRLESGPLLRFHNGRVAGETRRPRPTPSLRKGKAVRVWLVV